MPYWLFPFLSRYFSVFSLLVYNLLLSYYSWSFSKLNSRSFFSFYSILFPQISSIFLLQSILVYIYLVNLHLSHLYLLALDTEVLPTYLPTSGTYTNSLFSQKYIFFHVDNLFFRLYSRIHLIKKVLILLIRSNFLVIDLQSSIFFISIVI